MSQTVFWKDFALTVFDSVYKPRADSFLLADALDAVDFNGRKTALEVGCGTGLQSLALALKGLMVTAVDLNLEAIKNTRFNAEKLGLQGRVRVKESDLFSAVESKFDVIVFNPPYVASDRLKDSSVDGGRKGRAVLDSFLSSMPLHLNEQGLCFFLQSSLNGIEKTVKQLEEMNFAFEIITRKKLFFEELVVFQCWKK